jgi:hypothetical protein
MRSDRTSIYFTREELDALAVGIDVDAINVRRDIPEAREKDIGCFKD